MDRIEECCLIRKDLPDNDLAGLVAEFDDLIDIRQPGELKACNEVLWSGARLDAPAPFM